MPDLTLLVLSDSHFVGSAQVEEMPTHCEASMGAEMLERAIRDACRRHDPDAVVLMGDLVQDGEAPGAARDMALLKDRLDRLIAGTACVVVPGNHDADADLVFSTFDDRPGPHRLGGYCLYTFSDRWDEEDVGRRPPEQMERFERFLSDQTTGPVIALQHNPLYPPIDDEYPFILSRATDIMDAYARAGVVLSLSGHYHRGQSPSMDESVHYYTAPSVSRSPFRYAVVELTGRRVEIHERALRLPQHPPLFDVHVHTQYAYCAENATAEGAVRRGRLLGLSGMCISEHADQLYLTEEEHSGGYVYGHSDYWKKGREGGVERMPGYRQEMAGLRAEGVKLGLEIELDAAGRPGVRPEDARGWDLLVGAVHWLAGGIDGRSERELIEGYLANAESLLSAGCRVLAHPFRLFRRNRLPVPEDLYRPVARLLVRYGAAAEINCHTNRPAPEFFALCIERGVKIALGSDAHRLSEVGDFYPQLEILRRSAAGRPLEEVLFTAEDASGCIFRGSPEL